MDSKHLAGDAGLLEYFNLARFLPFFNFSASYSIANSLFDTFALYSFELLLRLFEVNLKFGGHCVQINEGIKLFEV